MEPLSRLSRGIFAAASRGRGALTGRVVGARRDRDRDGLLVFFVGVVMFGAAAAVYRCTFPLVVTSSVRVFAQA